MRQMEASLTCAVCLSLFEEPVTLPVCSHNFCRPCVAECLGQGGPQSTVSCPLCRKTSPLPSDGGAAALPVNTTLAEVVKLLKPAKASRDATPEEASSALAPQLAVLGVPCEKHPGQPLQLYCRRCLRGGCGQCVSEEHRGIFHSVNLIDTVYQEEKLAFFNNLKKIRELHQILIQEISASPDDAGVVMQNEEEIIKNEFEKISSALEVRKKQLLEDLENQKKRKLKESLIWKRMKEVHRQTVENVLNDCEKLLNEYDPQRFLEVACNLNQRMKTQLDLMQTACSHENKSECKQVQMDTTSIVNDILALNLTADNFDVFKGDISSGDVEHTISPSPGNKWEVEENIQNKFFPVPGEDIVLDNGRSIPTQYMSLSAATVFESMSHEEMRYKYYLKHKMCLDELKGQTSQKEYIFSTKCLSSKNTTSGHDPSFLSFEAKNQKKPNMPTLRRPHVSEADLSNSVGFTFKAQAVNFNFCGSNNKLNLHSMDQSQNDTDKTFLSAINNIFQNTSTFLQPHPVAPPSEGHFSFTAVPKVPESTPTSVSTSVSGDITGHSASPIISGSSDNLRITTASKEPALTFEKEKVAFSSLPLGRCESQNCNIRNSINGYNSSDSTTGFLTAATTLSTISPKSGTVVTGNNSLSAFPVNSESDSCQTATVSSSEQKSFSLLSADQKELQENKTLCLKKLNNLGKSCLTSSSFDSSKQLVYNSNDPFSCKKSTSAASYMIDTSEKQPVPDNVSSKSICCTTSPPCLFSFKGATKNSGDSLTCIKPFKKTECANEKLKMKSKDKNLTIQKCVPSKKDVTAYKALKEIESGYFASINTRQRPETHSVVFPQQNVASDDTSNSTSVSLKLIETKNPLEISPAAIEDHRTLSSIPDGATHTINSDSDLEDLSQASNASDSSSASEYFSVAEDKISN